MKSKHPISQDRKVVWAVSNRSSLLQSKGSLRSHDDDAEDNDLKMNLCFTYESRDTLKPFTLFIFVQAITKLNLGHINKSDIKI